MDKRFIDFRPQISDIKNGPEPSLYNMLMMYYKSYGCTLEISDALAKEYINKWVKLENSNGF